mgnify:CR=1 FL=1
MIEKVREGEEYILTVCPRSSDQFYVYPGDCSGGGGSDNRLQLDRRLPGQEKTPR